MATFATMEKATQYELRLADRMSRLVALLEQTLEDVRAEQVVRERASLNGKVTPRDGSAGHD